MDEFQLFNNILGERLKKERNKLGITQEEMAKRLNITKQTISNWENGNRIPDTLTLGKLAQFFGVTTDYLLGIEGNNFEVTKQLISRKVGNVTLHFEDTKDMEEKLKIIKAVLEAMDDGKK